MELKMVCEICNADASVDEEKSDNNWTVYKNTCDKCGGKTKVQFY